MKNFLLPYPWKYPGTFLILSGVVLAILYIWFDFRFTIPVFAVFSSFVETKMFVTFNTNFADELIMLLFISGFGLLVFSKERVESENLDPIRDKALVMALFSNNLLLLCSVLFVYGSGFITILVLNLITLPVFYLCFFYFMKQREMDRLHRTK
jgi:CHASE2 domain-containing sensor protein